MVPNRYSRSSVRRANGYADPRAEVKKLGTSNKKKTVTDFFFVFIHRIQLHH